MHFLYYFTVKGCDVKRLNIEMGDKTKVGAQPLVPRTLTTGCTARLQNESQLTKLDTDSAIDGNICNSGFFSYSASERRESDPA